MSFLRDLGIADDTGDTFVQLGQGSLISTELALSMERMVGIRNIAVHEYQELDLAKVRYTIEHRLDDLSAFTDAILAANPTA